MAFPVKECDDCCHWAVLGKDRCVYHLYKPAAPLEPKDQERRSAS